jgi:hypothetical protein
VISNETEKDRDQNSIETVLKKMLTYVKPIDYLEPEVRGKLEKNITADLTKAD